jgi:hypothetical protein
MGPISNISMSWCWFYAKAEHVEVKGTVWLISEMVREQRITVAVARAALQKMRTHRRRLPWDVAEQMLLELDAKLFWGG